MSKKVCAFMLFVVQSFAAWDGSISLEAPNTAEIDGKTFYLIENESELAWFANETNKHGARYDINAKLVADLDMNHKLWTPMAAGKGDVAFEGIIDGDNHVISNLYINSDEIAQIKKEYAQNLGFVGVLGNGVVKNIDFENVDIVTSTDAGSILSNKDNQISVGAVVGWLADKKPGGVVLNCHVSGNISATGNGQGIGGVVGNAKNGTIEKCRSSVAIKATGDKAHVGGIVGITKANLTVNACVYDGEGLSNAGNGSTGNVVGYHLSGTLTYRYGAVAITEDTDKRTAVIDGEYMGPDTVAITEDVPVNQVDFQRTYTVNKMSSMMMPFSIDTANVEGAVIYEFKEVTHVDDVWKVKVRKAAGIVANTPYMVVPKAEKIKFNIDTPVIFNTTAKTRNNLSTGSWEFKGVYAYTTFENDPDVGRIYGFAATESDGVKVGQFVKVGEGAWASPMRAYLVHHAAAVAAKTRGSLNGFGLETPLEMDIVVVDDNDNVLETGKLNTVTGEVRMDRWFDLNGRKLNAKPTTRGTYYHNGKREIVK